MRLWSLHPQYLDSKGLVALWREGLLAQAVLAGRTRGYTRHPQLERFRDHSDAREVIAAYLRDVIAEAGQRGYHFDESKVPAGTGGSAIPVSAGQMAFEWQHLKSKLIIRDPRWHERLGNVLVPRPHPLFAVVPGPIAPWERNSTQSIRSAR